MTARWRQFFRYWFLRETVLRAMRVSCVVAPVLVAINHAEALFALEVTPRLVFKIALTFVVPYVVSSYSSAKAMLRDPT